MNLQLSLGSHPQVKTFFFLHEICHDGLDHLLHSIEEYNMGIMGCSN